MDLKDEEEGDGIKTGVQALVQGGWTSEAPCLAPCRWRWEVALELQPGSRVEAGVGEATVGS